MASLKNRSPNAANVPTQPIFLCLINPYTKEPEGSERSAAAWKWVYDWRPFDLVASSLYSTHRTTQWEWDIYIYIYIYMQPKNKSASFSLGSHWRWQSSLDPRLPNSLPKEANFHTSHSKANWIREVKLRLCMLVDLEEPRLSTTEPAAMGRAWFFWQILQKVFLWPATTTTLCQFKGDSHGDLQDFWRWGKQHQEFTSFMILESVRLERKVLQTNFTETGQQKEGLIFFSFLFGCVLFNGWGIKTAIRDLPYFTFRGKPRFNFQASAGMSCWDRKGKVSHFGSLGWPHAQREQDHSQPQFKLALRVAPGSLVVTLKLRQRKIVRNQMALAWQDEKKKCSKYMHFLAGFSTPHCAKSLQG